MAEKLNRDACESVLTGWFGYDATQSLMDTAESLGEATLVSIHGVAVTVKVGPDDPNGAVIIRPKLVVPEGE